jgi:predicted kinase
MTGLILNSMLDKARPTFIMLVGIPGSGKSTYANQCKNDSTIYLSSDLIRKELYGDEGCQDDSSRVFNLMHERTLEALKSGYDVIYDATNLTRKSRRSILSQIPAYVNKKCVIVWAPISYCISRDMCRGRVVGEAVIDKMLKRFEAPFYDEGFDDIEVYYSGEYSVKEYFASCQNALKIAHDNPHHTADVADHCALCGDGLLDQELPPVVKFAGYVHDIGKPYTKTFINNKGETTEIAHYYGHQAAGAWISYGLKHDNTITLAWLISTHMAPFTNQKYYNSLDPLYKNWIDVLHKADLEAH